MNKKTKEAQKGQITKLEQGRESKRRNEINEIITQLNNNNIDVKRQAIRRIISAMTVGKDVSMLFSAIVKNMETQNLELKKLIYLYIINYARIHQDLAVLAINTLSKDASDKKNPFMRALAIRTMGCLRIKQITEYIIGPVQEALYDEDSYVRKTAVLCIAKLYDSNPELIVEMGFLKFINNTLNDGNAMVVANAVICLKSIEDRGGATLRLEFKTVDRLLMALTEATEWGQTIILDVISTYPPENPQQAEKILERVSVYTSHRNAGVVLGSIRVMVRVLDYLQDDDLVRNYCRRISPSLITLVSCDNEIKFVALKNISLIAEKRPVVVENELHVFFCGFSDPFYVKCEKLEIIVKLANENNIDLILHELKDYVAEVDVDFVRKCIKAIGRLAIKIEAGADKCVQALYDILKQKSSLILQESIIVMKDIFRRYPGKYEGILEELFSDVKTIDEPESRAAMVWILGEYIQEMENGADIINNFFLASFKDETPQVQLQLITACVRLFLLEDSDKNRDLIMKVFHMLEDMENVDVRDRGYFYWRLTSKDPAKAQEIILKEKPRISEQGLFIEPNLLETLIENFDSLSCVYRKPPQSFVRLSKEFSTAVADEEQVVEEDDYGRDPNGFDSDGNQLGSYGEGAGMNNDYLNDMMNQEEKEEDRLEARQIAIPMLDVLSFSQPGIEKKVAGIAIKAAFQLENSDEMFLHLAIANQSGGPIDGFAIKFNTNSYFLSPIQEDIDAQAIKNNEVGQMKIPIGLTGNSNGKDPDCPFTIQVALSTSIDVFVFFIPCSFSVLLRLPAEYNEAKLQELLGRPNQITTQNSIPFSRVNECLQNPGILIEKFMNNNFLFVSQKVMNDQIIMSFVTSTIDQFDLPFQVLLRPNETQLLVKYLVPHPALVKLFYQALKSVVDYSA
jgi:vesicle coat complex subunit